MISAAGGINSETAVQAYEAGADIIIVGGSLYKAKSPEESARKIAQSLKMGKPIATKEFMKYDASHLVEAFMKVSTANISDAMHKTGELRGLKPVWVGEPGELKFAGPAVTVRTYNGDWSAPVQAIDQCQTGRCPRYRCLPGRNRRLGRTGYQQLPQQGRGRRRYRRRGARHR